MHKANNLRDDFVITLKPDATPEQIERFISELAYAIVAIARHVVADAQNPPEGEEARSA